MAGTRTDSAGESAVWLRTVWAPEDAACRAALYSLAGEILEMAPSSPRLRDWAGRVAGLDPRPERVGQTTQMLKAALEQAILDESSHRQAWHEFDRLLSCSGKRYVRPYASVYCDPEVAARINCDVCHQHRDKACPYGDCYCVNRQGAACDHLPTGLRLAGRLWADVERAVDRRARNNALARLRRFTGRHLKGWMAKVSEALFPKVSRRLYLSTILLIDALIESERD